MGNDFIKDIEDIEDLDDLEVGSFDLQLFFKTILIRKRLFLFIFLASLFYTFASTTFKYFFSPVYRGEFALLISDPLKDEKVQQQFGQLDQKDVISKLALNTTSNDITTLIELLKSKNIIEPIAKKYNIPLRNFSRKLEIKVGGGIKRYERAEGILVVSLTGRKPNITKNILNDLSQHYLKTALKQRQQKLSDGLNFLNEQEPALSNKTIEIQSKIEEFRIKNRLIEPIIESNILKESQIAFEKKIKRFLLERKRLEWIRDQIINGNLIAISFKEDIMASGEQNNIRSNGLFFTDADQGLLEQYSKLELMIAEASTKFKQDSTVIESLKLKLKELKPLLIKKQLKAVDKALNINEQNIQNIESINEEISKEFLLKPSLIKEYETLQLRLNIASNNLKALVSAREILQLEIAQNSFPWSVIDNPTVSKRPVKPRVKRNLFLGIILSLSGSLVAVFLRNRLDNVFQDPTEISKNLKLPILTYIPFLKNICKSQNNILNEIEKDENEEKNSNYSEEKFLFEESFRELYTSIRFLSNDSNMKSICITSSIGEEGKSIISLKLAETLVSYNQKVLIVDANMRYPTIHSMIKRDNLIGFSNLLSDDSLTLKDVIQSYQKKNIGFEFISGGQVISNPSKLIDSVKFKEVLDNIKNLKKYDYLIFDTPPILGITDTPFLSRCCDFSLFVVSLDYVDKRLPAKSFIKMKRSSSPILGVIANSVKESYEINLTKFGFGKYSFGKAAYGYNYEKKKDYFKENNLISVSESESDINKDKNLAFIGRYLKTFFRWIDEK